MGPSYESDALRFGLLHAWLIVYTSYNLRSASSSEDHARSASKLDMVSLICLMLTICTILADVSSSNITALNVINKQLTRCLLWVRGQNRQSTYDNRSI